MTSPALCIDAGESTEKVKDLIVNKKISSVPITRDGKLVGIISKDAMLVAL